MAVYLGLDGGGSSVKAMALNEARETVFEGKSGPGNWASTPRHEFRKHVMEAAVGCAEPKAVCGCFAGLLTRADVAECESLLAETFPGAMVAARPDYHAALAAAEDDEAVGLIAGTGSLAFSWVGDRIVKSGGGGALLGDEGSAFRMGRACLRRYLFGRDESLKPVVLEVLGAEEENDVIAAVYRAPGPAGQVAKFAAETARRAQAGESWAGTIVRQELQDLARVADDHCTRHHPERRRLALAGGLWDIHPIFEQTFREILAESGETRWSIGHLTGTPSRGAALLAIRLQR